MLPVVTPGRERCRGGGPADPGQRRRHPAARLRPDPAGEGLAPRQRGRQATLRTALVPVVTAGLGSQPPAGLGAGGGGVALPGIGSLMVQSVFDRGYPDGAGQWSCWRPWSW
ncbi:hypothetical protein HBB16_00875 [Pseudonocardia sp. MCCB 268]|nr:hypothetical protein [Pseudonocardia cytotoxica]